MMEFGPTPAKIHKCGEDTEFPDTIEGFGYTFNDFGQLRKIDPETGRPGEEGFEFNVCPDDPDYNQRRYEKLGQLITEYVYNLLETEVHLQKVYIPEGFHPERQTFIFMSSDAMTTADRLLLLVHGSGVVRAGQWARRLIINDSLQFGTQIPFIEKAKEEGYEVMVLNTNDNFRIINGRKEPIMGSESPNDHTHYVWENFVQKSRARHVAIIAHSYGGVCIINLAKNHFDDFSKRVFAVALTDSVHNMGIQRVPRSTLHFLKQVGRNWVSSMDPVDTSVLTPVDGSDVDRVSAGHPRHEMTSWSSFTSIFAFLKERFDRRLKAEL